MRNIHPNIVRIHNVGQNDFLKYTHFINKNFMDVPFVELEMAAGGNLSDYLLISSYFKERIARYYFH